MPRAERLNYRHHGLRVYKTADDKEYAVAYTVEQANKAARFDVYESLWAFKPEFVVDFIQSTSKRPPFDDNRTRAAFVKALASVQEKLCKDANAIIRHLVRRVRRFAEDAIAADGRGHFLASYDGNELEVADHPSLGLPKKALYAYRIS